MATDKPSTTPSAIQVHNCNKFYHWEPHITMAKADSSPELARLRVALGPQAVIVIYDIKWMRFS